MLNGIAKPIIACVDGIPYSCDHLFCNLTAGGHAGLGQRIISFNPCPENI